MDFLSKKYWSYIVETVFKIVSAYFPRDSILSYAIQRPDTWGQTLDQTLRNGPSALLFSLQTNVAVTCFASFRLKHIDKNFKP